MEGGVIVDEAPPWIGYHGNVASNIHRSRPFDPWDYTSFNASASSPALLPARRPNTMPALRPLPPG